MNKKLLLYFIEKGIIDVKRPRKKKKKSVVKQSDGVIATVIVLK